jgi:hypothetical protein
MSPTIYVPCEKWETFVLLVFPYSGNLLTLSTALLANTRLRADWVCRISLIGISSSEKHRTLNLPK